MTACSTSHKVVDWEAAARWVKELQAEGQKVVFTNGCFDLLHVGHVRYLEEARALGDALIIGVNTDLSVARLGKGGGRPLTPEADRARVLAACACVDRVVLFGEDTPLALITLLAPDILVKGKNVLLVDDLFTTGSTVKECARVLRKAGACQVEVLTVARVRYD